LPIKPRFSGSVLLGVLLTLVVTDSLHAQQERDVGPGRKLQPALDTIAVTVQMSEVTVPFATAVESLRLVTRGGRSLWEQSYQWFGNDGSRTADTLWYDASTLVSVENHRHNRAYDAVTTFTRSTIRSRFTPRDGNPQVADTTVNGPFYASGELATLIRVAPLAPGYSAAYTLHYGPPHSLRNASFKVVGSTMVRDRRGRNVECWVVDAGLSEGQNMFYVGKADRRVVRLVNHEDPKAAFVFTR
jgi:hypothetical protein